MNVHLFETFTKGLRRSLVGDSLELPKRFTTAMHKWRYLFGFVRGIKLEPLHLIHKKSKGAKIVKFFIFNLDFSCQPITMDLLLKFNPHGTLQERWNLTLQGRNFTKEYRRGLKLVKSHLAKNQTSTANVWAYFGGFFGALFTSAERSPSINVHAWMFYV